MKYKNFHIANLDLENGRYTNIISYLDSVRSVVTVSIQEIGMLTKEVFVEEIYHIYEDEYGLEVVPDSCIHEKLQANDMFEVYNKYKFIIDTMVLETFKEE